MKILVVNDDSIYASGIELLAKKACELGEVYVVAPARQNSAMSQRLSMNVPLRVEKVENFPAPVKAAYKVEGTPVDCVKVALQYLLEDKPDYVFSGINDGYNSGYDIAFSGTMGAAFEALRNGIPAIAFSRTMFKGTEVCDKYLLDIAKELIREGQGKNEVWNVNFPEVGEIKGILRERTIAPTQFFSENYIAEKNADGSVTLTSQSTPLSDDYNAPEGTDIHALLNGYISIGKVKCAVIDK